MKRREFIALLGGAVITTWHVAAGQTPNDVRRIGVLMGILAGDQEAQSRLGAFQQNLEKLGWADGRDVRVDYRWTGADPELMRAHAAELVALAPDVILANATPAVAALKEQTRTTPIVFVLVTDPIASGFVESWARPDRNITGFASFESSMASKWLEALQRIAPHVTDVVLLFSPDAAPGGGTIFLRAIEHAAPAFGLNVKPAPLRSAVDIEEFGRTLAGQRHTGIVVMPDVFTTAHRELIVGLAARHNSPAIYPFRFFSVSGGLISYGIDTADVFRRAAFYVDRILRGAKVSELPVQAPTKFELVINLRTAKALGLAVPSSLLALVDEVIE
jgi:putative tryptophan/tyrosine transport system substrate-binding protein